jgi:hypothetical protein
MSSSRALSHESELIEEEIIYDDLFVIEQEEGAHEPSAIENNPTRKKRKNSSAAFESEIMDRMDNVLPITNARDIIEYSDILFLKSLHEPMKRLSELKQALMKIKMLELLHNAKFGDI